MNGATGSPPLPTTEADWAFLRPWVALLDGRVVYHTTGAGKDDSDAVRIGRDPADDFWLFVALEREDVLRHHAEGEREALREIREAVILAHLLASVQYDLWYEWMVVGNDVYLPPWLHEKNSSPKIRLRYVFEFSREHDDSNFLRWDRSLSSLLGVAHMSDDFVRDLHRTQELLGRHGIQWSDVKPVPIMLRWLAHADSHTVPSMLSNIRSAVDEIQFIEEIVAERGITETSGPGAGAVFTVTNLELDLGQVTMTSRIFSALHEVLRLGVPVDYLSLPVLDNSSDLDRVAQIPDIGAFMRTLVGVSASNKQGRLTQVRWIVMPLAYTTTNWFAPFCSALATARFVRTVHLKNCGLTTMIDYRESDGGFSSTSAMRCHIWSWLAFALLSSASSSSVETLVVDGEALRSDDVEAIQAVMESEDPLGLLCERTHESGRRTYQLPSTPTKPLIHLPRGSRPAIEFDLRGFFSVQDGQHDSTGFRFDRSERLDLLVGELLHELDDREPREDDDQATRRQADDRVFVPGFGFCQVKLQNPNTKRTRRECTSPETSYTSSSSFRTLRLRTQQLHSTTHAALRSLLGLIGPRLRGLGMDVPGVTEQTVDQIFAACPQLESLAVRGIDLSSMEIFTRAYDHHALPLSSLDLTAVSVPERELQRWLRALTKRHTRMSTTLQRLRVGSGWAHELSSATLALVESVLRENNTLTHVHCSITSEQCHRGAHDALEAHHGRLVHGLSHADRARRLAFLGVLRHQTVELNSHVRQRVLEFAMPRPVQRVVRWQTTDVGGAIPLLIETVPRPW